MAPVRRNTHHRFSSLESSNTNPANFGTNDCSNGAEKLQECRYAIWLLKRPRASLCTDEPVPLVECTRSPWEQSELGYWCIRLQLDRGRIAEQFTLLGTMILKGEARVLSCTTLFTACGVNMRLAWFFQGVQQQFLLPQHELKVRSRVQRIRLRRTQRAEQPSKTIPHSARRAKTSVKQR